MNQRLRLQFLAEPKCHGGTVLVDFVTPELARQVYLSSIPGIAPDGAARVAAVDSDGDGTSSAAPGRSYRVVACGIDPVTRAFIGWHPVEAGNACGFAVGGIDLGLLLASWGACAP